MQDEEARSPAEIADAMVDEASLESMDCSDPPAYGGFTTAPPALEPTVRALPSREARRGRALRAGALFAAGMGLLAWAATRGRGRTRSRRGASLLQGVLVGVAATQALDWLSIALYESEDDETRVTEDTARGHRHAYEVAMDRMARGLGLALSEDELRRWAWRFHKVFGVAGGIGYVALRKRSRAVSACVGTLFGSAFFLVVDELLVPATGLTPGPRAFPWKTHARGAASHVAYGVAAELAARALER